MDSQFKIGSPENASPEAPTTTRISSPPCETFTRLVGRLTEEVQRLTREIPLREGQVLELKQGREPDLEAIGILTEMIERERARLLTAELDLVTLEQVIRQNCGASTRYSMNQLR